MCYEGKPNRQQVEDGECFWGFVVQFKNNGRGHSLKKQWILLRFDHRYTGGYFNAESNQLQRVEAKDVHGWKHVDRPIVVP